MIKRSLFALHKCGKVGTCSYVYAARTRAVTVVRFQSTAQPPGTGSSPTDKTIFDTESEMFQLRRKMAAAYSQGNYQVALDHAVELKDKAIEIMGKRTTVYGSSLNNIALMYKMLGEQDKALEVYKAAVKTYEDVTGKEHASYATALANLGVLYKEMSKGRTVSSDSADDAVTVPVKGKEKQDLLDKAEQALTEAHATRLKLLGESHRDSLFSAIHLASLWKLRGRPDKAKELLSAALATAEAAYTPSDLICASIHNDLGVLLKGQGQLAEAKTHYTTALDIRKKALGDGHPDTIVTTYNLAELHSAVGDAEQAKALQEHLVVVHESKSRQLGGPAAGEASSPFAVQTETAGLAGGKLKLHRQVNSYSSPKGGRMGAEGGSEDPAAIAAQIAEREAKEKAESAAMSPEELEKKQEAVLLANRPTKPATRKKPQTKP